MGLAVRSDGEVHRPLDAQAGLIALVGGVVHIVALLGHDAAQLHELLRVVQVGHNHLARALGIGDAHQMQRLMQADQGERQAAHGNQAGPHLDRHRQNQAAQFLDDRNHAIS